MDEETFGLLHVRIYSLSFTVPLSSGACWAVPVILPLLEPQAVLRGQQRVSGPLNTSGIAWSVNGIDVMDIRST
jgi:hypothetical protein